MKMLKNIGVLALALFIVSFDAALGSSGEGAVSLSYARNQNTNSNKTDLWMQAIDEALITPDNIDPNDPEEKARLKYLRENMNVYEHIFDINSHLNETDELIEGDIKKSVFRNAGGGRPWPKTTTGSHRGLVRIPYTISSEYTAKERQTIISALQHYKKYTCIRFIPRTSERNYIHIHDSRGCWAYVGTTNSPKQTVSLGSPGCVTKGVALHELMHTLGFQHEQSRNDRDDYVRVIGENIEGGWNPNYSKMERTRNLVIYDYGSVMHYGKSAFSRKAYLPAIVVYPDRDPKPLFGQRQRLSPYDIEEINYLYTCGAGTFPRCGRDFTNQKRGSFTSPAHPKAYPTEAHCTWKITVARGRFVEVTFANVNIEESPLCQKDAILVHNGPNGAAPVLERICGRKSSVVVTSTVHEIFVIFSSDVTEDRFTGFRASFKEVSIPGSITPALRILPPTLPPVQDVVSSISCNFDHDLCGMTQDTSDATDFIQQRGRTPTSRTGPDGDQSATGEGRYLFLESSQPAKLGDTARLRTPWFKRADEFCVSFSYHMYGQFMGGLRVYAFEKRTSNNIGTAVKLWEKFDNQGNKWIDHSITYKPRKNVQYIQFYVEGFIYFYLSDLAIDNFSVLPGTCGSVTTVRPQTGPTTRPTTTPLVGGTRKTFRCNFESGYCGLKQTRGDTFNWGRRQGRTPTQGTGPVNDHTSGVGHYAYVESSSPRKEGDTAMLETPALSPNSHCLQFWYVLNGRTMGTLSVILEVDGARSTLKEFEGHQGQPWVKMSATISPGKNNARYIKVLFESTIGSGVYSDMAIDDIVITNKPCKQAPTVDPSTLPTSFNCNFETNLCGLKQLPDDNFDWTRQRGKTPSTGTGPSTDHTLKTNKGYYLFTESSNPQRQHDIAKLLTPKMRPGTYCVRFAYHMYGSSVGNIEVMTLEAPSEIFTTEWRQDGDQTDRWHMASFDFTSSGNAGSVEFLFQGQIGTGFSSDVALDDIRITRGTCSGVTTPKPLPTTTKTITTASTTTRGPLPSTFACNFESSELCGMVQRQNDDFDWTRKQGKTLSSGTGPSGDNTVNLNAQGNYIYVEASYPNRAREVAAVSTPLISANSRQICVLYYYHMYGSTVGQLDIIAEQYTSSNQRTIRTLSSKSGNQGNRWFLNQMTIDMEPRFDGGSLRITFQASLGTTSSSDIALDDICIAPGPCGQLSQCSRNGVLVSSTNAPGTTVPKISTTPTTVTTTTTTTTAVSSFLSAFSCNFESPAMCGMNQENLDDDFDWTRNSGATKSKNTGPSGDHTVDLNGQGNYAYIEGTLPNRPGQSATFYTPLISLNAQEMCLVFHYHMFGTGVGQLRVIAHFTGRSTAGRIARTTRTLVRRSGNKGNRWHKNLYEIFVDQSFLGGSLKLEFEATIGSSSSSDIALDDICIAPGQCGFTRCHNDGYLMNSTFAPPTTTLRTTTPQTTTTTPQGPTTTVRPAPSAGAQEAWAGMPLCTFDTPQRSSSRIPSSNIPGSSTNDLGPYTYTTAQSTSALCGFIQFGSYDQFDWTRTNQGTLSANTGPSRDRTSASGHYMYIEASRRQKGDRAFLQSYFMPASDYCLDFYYHMYGSTMGSIVIKTVQTLNDGSRKRPVLRKLEGDQGNLWRNVKVDFTPEDNGANVAFRLEGVVGSSSKSDAAFDDFAVMPGRCDACQNPSHRSTVNGQVQEFASGCIHTGLFYVRCCSSSQPKAVYRRVRNCDGNMFSAARLNWYCQNL